MGQTVIGKQIRVKKYQPINKIIMKPSLTEKWNKKFVKRHEIKLSNWVYSPVVGEDKKTELGIN